LPAASAARPAKFANDAAVPTPLTLAVPPLPANVVTSERHGGPLPRLDVRDGDARRDADCDGDARDKDRDAERDRDGEAERDRDRDGETSDSNRDCEALREAKRDGERLGDALRDRDALAVFDCGASGSAWQQALAVPGAQLSLKPSPTGYTWTKFSPAPLLLGSPGPHQSASFCRDRQ
jgi:hypothetical protein